MTTSPKMRSDLAPVLAGVKSAGTLRLSQIWPLHTQASDLRFGVFSNGVLSLLFRVDDPQALNPGGLLEALPLGGGLQVYQYMEPGVGPLLFLALSAPVPYTYSFAPFKGVLSVLRYGFVSKELRKLEEATEATHQALSRAAAVGLGSEDAIPLEGFGPLLDILGATDPDATPPTPISLASYNLNYLLLPDKRLGLLGDTQFLPGLPPDSLPRPPEELESLLCTTFYLPPQEEQAKHHQALEDLSAFEQEAFPPKAKARRAPPTGRSVYRAAPQGPRYAYVRQYSLLLSERPLELKDAGEDYFSTLTAAGYPSHPSLVSSKDHYCHLFPGNYRIFLDGTLISSHLTTSLFERLLP